MIAFCAVNVFLCFTSLFGNFATLIAIWKTSSLHSPANTLLSSLAVSDFAVGLICHPLLITCVISASSRILWDAFNMLGSFLCFASFCTTTAIGVDRLLALQLHLRYESLVTQFRVCWVIFFIWVISAFLSSLVKWFFNLYLKVLVSVIVTLLAGNFVVYLRLYSIVHRHQLQIQQQQHGVNNGNIFSVRRFKKSAVNTFLVFILLLCCYSPFAVATGILVVGGEKTCANVYKITSTLIVLLNCSLNPLLYFWRVREIRTAIKHIVCC